MTRFLRGLTSYQIKSFLESDICDFVGIKPWQITDYYLGLNDLVTIHRKTGFLDIFVLYTNEK